jgi:hypothetical protein
MGGEIGKLTKLTKLTGLRQADAFGAGPDSRVFLALTTDVHPRAFYARPTARTEEQGRRPKGWFTSPRVRALNAAAAEAVRASNAEAAAENAAARRAGVRPPAGAVGVLDLFAPTEAIDEADPRMLSDMRHYGPATVAQLARAVLDAVCPEGDAGPTAAPLRGRSRP